MGETARRRSLLYRTGASDLLRTPKDGCVLPRSADSLSFAFMEAPENKKQPHVVVPSPAGFPALDSCAPLVAHPRSPHLPTCHAFPHDTQVICCEHGIVRVSSRRGGETLSIDTCLVQTTTTTCSLLRFRLSDQEPRMTAPTQ